MKTRAVRSAEPKDVPEIVAIDSAAFPSPSQVGLGPDLRSADDRDRRRLRFEEELCSPSARLWVVEVEGKIAAYLNALVAPGEVHLLHVATLEERRREGLGRLLVKHLLAFAEGADAIVVLEVRKGNEAATRLYESLGLEISRIRKGYYPDGEDAIEFVSRRSS